MDKRIYLPEGYRLGSERQLYIIDRALSSGSNSVVYQAHYPDNLMPDHIHTVLIKELYPWEPVQRITRADPPERMELLVPEESASLFLYHRDSFLMGNQAHLILSEAGNDFVAGNLDSFEANGTLYTVLTNRNGQVLSEVLEEKIELNSLDSAVRCVRSILYALQPFHSHGMLHLDISPDNIFLLKPAVPGKETEEVLLLDFNSVYSMDGSASNECRYYLGKQDYMAPEVRLHNSAALGPWTDLYSVCAVFYEMISQQKLPLDLELTSLKKVVSDSLPLFQTLNAALVEQARQILIKGLAFRHNARYRSVSELLEDLDSLLRAVSEEKLSRDAVISGDPSVRPPHSRSALRSRLRIPIWALTAVFLSLLAALPSLRGVRGEGGREVNTAVLPLERDDSVVLTQINLLEPLKNNILEIPLDAPTSVRATLKDYEHPDRPGGDLSSYAAAAWYSGEGDVRGWQGGESYEFFTGDMNKLHFTMPIADAQDFPLEYVALSLHDFDYDDSRILLDVTQYTLTDGDGNRYEMTELTGSHILYFEPDHFVWYLMTSQSQEYVKNFKDVRGGSIEVEAAVSHLDSLMDVTWESSDPSVAEVNEKGFITPVAEGTSVITVTLRDKNSGDIKRTQMLVRVTPAKR